MTTAKRRLRDTLLVGSHIWKKLNVGERNQPACFQTYPVEKSCLSLWEEVSGGRRAKNPGGCLGPQHLKQGVEASTGQQNLMSKNMFWSLDQVIALSKMYLKKIISDTNKQLCISILVLTFNISTSPFQVHSPRWNKKEQQGIQVPSFLN